MWVHQNSTFCTVLLGWFLPTTQCQSFCAANEYQWNQNNLYLTNLIGFLSLNINEKRQFWRHTYIKCLWYFRCWVRCLICVVSVSQQPYDVSSIAWIWKMMNQDITLNTFLQVTHFDSSWAWNKTQFHFHPQSILDELHDVISKYCSVWFCSEFRWRLRRDFYPHSWMLLCSDSDLSCLLSHCIFIQYQRVKLRRKCWQLMV